jgi:hypothetical protein
MSKQNKVNPGMYTQAGRLTPDDTARELKKQREAASPGRNGDQTEPHQREANRVTKKDKAAEEEESEDSMEE